MRNKKQREKIGKLTREYQLETDHNLKKLEREREALSKMLANAAYGDVLTQETLKATIAQIEKTIEQVKSIRELSGRLEAWEGD